MASGTCDKCIGWHDLDMQAVPRVLIVDDDADTLRLYGFALELFGMEVVTVGSALDGLRAVEADIPHIVVTDLAMPGMDGIAFCRALKAGERTRHIPVLAVSGQAIESTEAEARAAGCREVLKKPCEPDTLYSTISRMLEESAALNERAAGAARGESRRIREGARAARTRRRR